MSTTIDSKVVEMRFDNKQFESGVQTSLGTLDKLKQSLKLTDSAKGLEEVNNTARKFDISGMSNGLETVKAKFSALQVIGVTALANLTNSAVNAGKRLLSSLGNSIIQGGKNRAMNLENAHFQLQGLLNDEKAVSAVMKNVNDSVDGTAYSLDSAAKVASQLAASGMRAGDEMFSSLRAVAGVAAMTNSEYDDIGRIFTKVAGQGRLMGDDLLSLSARGMNAAATLGKYLNKSEAEVRDMVSKGKIDFNTFSAAMDDAFGEHAKKANETFTGSISNIKAALARIGAEFVSPLIVQNGSIVKLFNTIRERINDVKSQIGPFADLFTGSVIKMADAAREFLSDFDVTDHVTAIYNVVLSLVNVFKAIGSILKPIGQAFRDVFLSALSTTDIISFTESLKALTEKFKISETTAAKLKDTFMGVFGVIKIGINIIKNLVSGIAKLLGHFGWLGSDILDVTGSLGKWLYTLSETGIQTDAFGKAINGLVGFLGLCIDKLKAFTDKLKEVRNAIAEKLKLNNFEIFKKLFTTLNDLASKAGKRVAEFARSVSEAFTKKSATNAVGLAGAILLLRKAWIKGNTIFSKAGRYKEIFSALANGVKDFLGIGDKIKSAFSALSSSLWQLNRKIKYETVRKFAEALAILAGSMFLISKIDSEKLGASLGVVATLMTGLMGFAAVIEKISPKGTVAGKGLKGFITAISDSMLGISKTNNITTTLIKMASALLILAIAMRVIADISPEDTLKGILAISALMTILVLTSKEMSKLDGSMLKGAGNLILVAASMKIFASAAKDFGSMDWESLGKAGAAMTVLLGALAAFAKITQTSNEKLKGKGILFSKDTKSTMLQTSIGLIAISVAMKIFASAAKDFGSLDWESLGKAGAAMGSILLAVAGFDLVARKSGNMIKASAALVIIGASMKIFASAAKDFGSMDWESLGKAGAALGAILALVTAFNLLSNLSGSKMTTLTSDNGFFGKKTKSTFIEAGVGLIAISVAMKIFASAAKDFGSMDWESLGKAGLAIGVILASTATAMHFMQNALPGAAALLVVSAAMVVFAGAMKILGSMSLGSIVKALVAIGAAIFIFAGAAAGLAEIIPAMLGLAGAIALIGISCLAVGVGIFALAAGLTMLSGMTTAVATSLVATISIIIVGLLELIPSIIGVLKDVVVALCQVFIESLPAIGETIKTLIHTVIDVIVECVPEIVEAGLFLLTSFLQSLAEHMPDIVQAGYDIIISLLEGLGNNIEGIVNAAGDIIINFLNALGEKIPEIQQAGVDLMIDFINGMADGIENNAQAVKDAIDNLCNSMLSAVKTFFGIHSPSTVMNGIGGNITEGLKNGINENESGPTTAIKTLASNMLSGISSKLGEFRTKGSETISNLRNGMSGKASDVKSEVTQIVSNAIQNIGSKLSQFRAKGIELISNLRKGIDVQKSNVISAVGSIVSSILNKLKETLSNFRSIGSNMMEGLKEGIKSKISSVISAATTMAKNTYEAVKEKLEINSPSKLFRRLGSSIPEGFAQGIGKFADKIRNSAVTMADVAVDETKSAMLKMAEFTDDTYSQPAIRPVVDLSDISTPYTAIDLGANINTNFMARPMDSLSQLMRDAQDEINASNLEVIDAVNGLRDDLNNLYSSDDGAEIALYVEGRKLASTIAKPMNQQLQLIAKRGG